MSCCELCGRKDEPSFLEAEFVVFAQKILQEINIDENTITCMECNIFIYQIKIFIEKVQSFAEKLPEDTNESKRGIETSCSDENFIEEIYELEDDSLLDDNCENEDVLTIEKVPWMSRKKENEFRRDNEKNDDEKLFTFKCHVCDDLEFTKMFQLSAHTRSKHNCLPLVKCFCDKLLSTMRALLRHRKLHFPRDDDIKCTECTKTFKTQKGLDNHFERTHGENKRLFICDQCGVNFCNAKVLQRHEVTHQIPSEMRRNFDCPECGKSFISNEAMKCHHAKYHDKVLSFFCDVCSKGFFTRKSLYSHAETHKPNEYVSCDLCSGIFKTVKYLKKHRRSHFLPPQSQLYVCDLCCKEFRKKSQLKMHILVHSETADHNCQFCQKSFKKKSYLKSHLAFHTGEKKSICMFCSRSFADSGNCRKHKLREHAQELFEYEEKYGKKGISNALYFDLRE